MEVHFKETKLLKIQRTYLSETTNLSNCVLQLKGIVSLNNWASFSVVAVCSKDKLGH